MILTLKMTSKGVRRSVACTYSGVNSTCISNIIYDSELKASLVWILTWQLHDYRALHVVNGNMSWMDTSTTDAMVSWDTVGPSNERPCQTCVRTQCKFHCELISRAYILYPNDFNVIFNSVVIIVEWVINYMYFRHSSRFCRECMSYPKANNYTVEQPEAEADAFESSTMRPIGPPHPPKCTCGYMYTVYPQRSAWFLVSGCRGDGYFGDS